MDIADELMKTIITPAIESSMELKGIDSLEGLFGIRKESLGLSERAIAKLLDMETKTLRAILNGETKHVDVVNIIKLAHFLGLSIADLMKLYIPDMDKSRIGELQRARESGFIVEYFDVASLKRMKFFKASDNMATRICRFFGLENIYSYADNCFISALSRTRRNSNDLMRNFWLKSAYAYFEGIDNPYPYDRAKLVDLMPRIRGHSLDERNGMVTVMKALYTAGVTVVYQPAIAKLQVRSATMIVNDKPCVVISNFNNSYPTLWFTLLHELYHVLYDLDTIRAQTYHLSEDGDLFLIDENKADVFATEYHLNKTRLNFISAYLHSNRIVADTARKWGVHPSIIYSIYCYSNPHEWARYRKYIPKADIALTLINTYPFDRDAIRESAKLLKETIYNI